MMNKNPLCTAFRKMVRNISASANHVALVGLIVLLAACSSSSSFIPGLGKDANDLDSITIEAAPDCNRNMPVAMDLVFVEDKKIASLLSEITGPDWFIQKPGLARRYGSKIVIKSFEVVPLSILEDVDLPNDHEDANHIFLFANYIGYEGQYVADLVQFKELKILLQRDGYQLLEMTEAE